MKGIIVCPQPRAADVGAEVLANGGNAFDAAIATAFAQMVADPFMCGLGGMGTWHYYSAGSGEHGMIDFHARAGARVTPEMWEADCRGRTEISGYCLFDDFRSEIGYTSIMTPGTVAGLWEAHRKLCSRPWAELLAPATLMAREGLAVTPFLLDFWTREPMPGVADGMARITATEACKDIFLHPEGRFYQLGEIHRNPHLANTFEILAEGGAEAFYRGALAERIAADLEGHGAFVTAADLAGYRHRSGSPVLGSYRGYSVASNPPPGSGVTLIGMLQILENFDLGSLPHNSAAHLDLVARAMAAAHADREEHLADSEFVPVPDKRLLSGEHAGNLSEKIRAGQFLKGGRESPPSCTTHLCVYDETGNAVSLTHTLGTGSGVVTAGLGFVYNNSMKLFDPFPGHPNSFAPGKARTTGMVPTMLFREGRPVLLAGAPGGSVIISSVLQSIINVVDFGMSPVEAVTVPRIHCEGGPVHAEARIQGAVCRALEEMGHEVRQSPISFDPVMSRAHLIQIREGSWWGGADPRGGGGVAYSR